MIEEPEITAQENIETENEVPIEPKVDESDMQPISSDPQYAKYFKMIHFGVPKPAVKLKMEQEGLDPSMLEWDFLFEDYFSFWFQMLSFLKFLFRFYSNPQLLVPKAKNNDDLDVHVDSWKNQNINFYICILILYICLK